MIGAREAVIMAGAATPATKVVPLKALRPNVVSIDESDEFSFEPPNLQLLLLSLAEQSMDPLPKPLQGHSSCQATTQAQKLL
jgi:hypothetical protein